MFHFLQILFLKKLFAISGPYMCFRRGGQRSMVKDHTFTFFLDPSLRGNCRSPPPPTPSLPPSFHPPLPSLLIPPPPPTSNNLTVTPVCPNGLN